MFTRTSCCCYHELMKKMSQTMAVELRGGGREWVVGEGGKRDLK